MKPACFSVVVLILLAGYSSGPEPAKPVAPAVKHAAPADESRKMPLENRVSAGVVDDHMLDREWLPGGTLGHYKRGGKEWDLILVRASSPATAADWLLDYKKELNGA